MLPSRTLPTVLLGASLAASLGVLGACAGDLAEPEIGADRSAIVNGAEATGDPGVVALVYRGQEFCTGTLVGRRTIVTAAHCLPPNIDLPKDEIDVFFGSSLDDDDGVFMPVVDALANPSWTSDSVGGDVGVVALANDAPALPVAIAYDDLSVTSGRGHVARAVGFGITSAGGDGNGVKREGTTTVDAIDASSIFLEPGPSATCNGDSGGPLFMVLDGVELLAGIHSRSDCDTHFIAERVDVHVMSFIQPFLEQHEGAGGCDVDGFCASGCDDPDPDCPCAGDGLCTAACALPAADVDCASECAEDGVCDESCGGDDVDCGATAEACAGDELCDDDGGGTGDGNDEGSGDDGGDEVASGGCATSGAAAGSSWLALLAIAALVSRRRRAI